VLVLVRSAWQRVRDRLRGGGPKLPQHLTITQFEHGPFAVVVTDPAWPQDPTYPIVVCPRGGFETRAAALLYVMRFAARETPYLGLRFAIAPVKSEAQFGVFCSWET